MNDWNMRKKVFVHSFEQAPDSGYWHYHAVTPDWWDVDLMREIATHHGFGRIDVKRVPAAKAEYVAKYVAKDCPDLPRGQRRWACHGFAGVKASDIEIKTSVDKVFQEDKWPVQLWDGVCVNLGELGAITVLHRSDAVPPLALKQMELKPLAQKEILAEVIKGKFVAVGEYRGCLVRKQEVVDKKAFQTVQRLIVEHTVEFGAASHKISEWLPVGASDQVKPPANKGDLVFVSITEISRAYGLKAEYIKPVTSLL